MNFWIDAQLPPSLANWLTETFNIHATAIRNLGLRDAEDLKIFNTARIIGTVIVTKDSDFVDLVTRLGTPPQILWVTCGNVTNQNLKGIFTQNFSDVLLLLQAGEMVVKLEDLF